MAQNIRYAKGTLKRFLFARLRTSSGQLYLGSRRSFPIPQLPSSLMTMMLPKGPAPAEKRPSVPFGSRNIVIIDGGRFLFMPVIACTCRLAPLSDGKRPCVPVTLPAGGCLYLPEGVST